MATGQHFDVIIIGTGAGGGTLAHRLAPTGKRVLLLERGDYLPRERDTTHDSACIRCDRVDGFPCLIGAKSDSQVICVDPALQHDNVTLVRNAFVRRLDTDASGRTVTRVQATVGDHEQVDYTADLVVVAAGAVNSAVLLLRSASDTHPNGLGNSSGVVGRHYMRHNNRALMAVSKEPNHTRFQKTLALTTGTTDPTTGSCRSAGIQMLGKSDTEQIRANVTVAKDDTVHLSLDEKNNVEGVKRLRAKLQGMLSDLGMEEHLHHHNIYLHKGMPIGATAHQSGTVRFGTDPESSALDVNCKAHDLDNLYVADTSFFPSIGAVNPSLTAIANAMRVGDHLIERMG